ncbi:MAG: ABC transporter ATP-binding protein [Phycisphaerales bacterium]|nr:ABC transporter ATP-binding protein [Phycisphaerales bacterium]
MDAPEAIVSDPDLQARSGAVTPEGPREPAIDVRNVQKMYSGKTHALRGVSLRVNRGEIFGLLGPNGAGKSTLVKILMSVVSPTRCEGTVLGMPVGHKPTFARVGYLPEHHRFPEYLTGAQVLDYFAALSNVPRALRRERCGDLLKLVGMQDWANVRVKRYSKGMRQRIGLAQALMNDPDLIILDEPTDGVDPVGRLEIRKVLLQQKELGKAVFVNSHLLSELELVCDRVAIMVKGRVTSQGTLEELTRESRKHEITFFMPDDDEAKTDQQRVEIRGRVVSVLREHLGRALQVGAEAKNDQTYQLASLSGIDLAIAYNTISAHTLDVRAVQPIIDALRKGGVIIRSVRESRRSLEDLFMEAVTNPTTGETMSIGAGGGGDRSSTGRNA